MHPLEDGVEAGCRPGPARCRGVAHRPVGGQRSAVPRELGAHRPAGLGRPPGFGARAGIRYPVGRRCEDRRVHDALRRSTDRGCQRDTVPGELPLTGGGVQQAPPERGRQTAWARDRRRPQQDARSSRRLPARAGRHPSAMVGRNPHHRSRGEWLQPRIMSIIAEQGLAARTGGA